MLVNLLLIVVWALAALVCVEVAKGPCAVAAAGGYLAPSQYQGLASELQADLARLHGGLRSHAGINLGLLDEAASAVDRLEEELEGLKIDTAVGAAAARDAYLSAVGRVCGPFAGAGDGLALAAACGALAMLGQVLLLVSHHTTYTVWYHLPHVPRSLLGAGWRGAESPVTYHRKLMPPAFWRRGARAAPGEKGTAGALGK